MERLTDEEEQILESLANYGALTASEISVKTLLLPDKVETILKELREKGFVKSLSLKERFQSVEQEAATLTPEGRRSLKVK